MSVISTLKTRVKQKLQRDATPAADPNDIVVHQANVHIYKLVDTPCAAKKIVDLATKRRWDDRFTGKVVLMIYGSLGYREWQALTRETATICPDSLPLISPAYARLGANGHQQFVFEKRAAKASALREVKRMKVHLDS